MIKFSCEKVFLQNAISVASRAVAQKSSIPALEGIAAGDAVDVIAVVSDFKGYQLRVNSAADVTKVATGEPTDPTAPSSPSDDSPSPDTPPETIAPILWGAGIAGGVVLAGGLTFILLRKKKKK